MPPRKRSASTKPSAVVVVPPLNLSILASNEAHAPASTERGTPTPLFTLLSTLYELTLLGLILLTVSRQTAGSAGYGGVPYTLLVSGLLSTLVFLCGLLGGSGQGNKGSFQQFLFSRYTGCGRLRNWVCGPCDRARGRYPLANTCQVPFFTSLSDVYTFVFGYQAGGLFVEVGAYDGESFSNTSGLGDMGWRGHYLEPIPQYAQAARARHAGNAPRVVVHTVCAGEVDGEAVELSAAGPFSSAVDDEISSVSGSALNATLDTLGWGHNKDSEKVKTTTKSLNTFFKEQGIQPGAVDVMVVDTEGFEWPILKSFNLAHWAPKLVIVEVQELQARYLSNERVQADATALYKKFADAGYRIVYKDVVNTVFKHPSTKCVGGS